MPRKQKSEVRGKKSEKVERDLQALTEDLKRVQADFVNYKRRAEADQAQIMEVAKQTVVAELLPILDDIKRALGHVPEELSKNPWAQGVGQVAKQADSVLQTLGVEAILAKGQEFNPELHEAVSFDEGEGSHEVVVEELRTGYKMGDRVIRPSMVKVAKRSKK